ncbi:UDP-N-acetylglucosamine 2-epimerase [compost metagenome]
MNIGDRQKGRLKAASVIDAHENRGDIVAAIRQALSPVFQETLLTTESLYGSGNAAAAIVAQLKQPLPDIRKRFFDITHGN